MEIICQTCMHHCRLAPRQRGLCRARINKDGLIRCENYGRITSLALDPIEKTFKPVLSGQHDFIGGKLWLQFKMPFLPEP